MKTDLFNPADVPFNLAGESLNEEFDAQREAEEKRVRELAEQEAKKAQREMFNGDTVRCPDHRNGGATRCPRGGAALQIWQRRQWGD